MWARLPDPDETESGDFSFLFVVVAARSDGSCWTPFLDPVFGIHFWSPFLKMLKNGLRRAPAPIWAPGHLKCQSKTVLERPFWGAPQNQGPNFKPKLWTPFWTPFLHPILESAVKWPPEGPRAALGPRRSKVSCHLPRKQGGGAARPPRRGRENLYEPCPPTHIPTHPPPH